MTSICFQQYIAGYTVANFRRYPIRSSVTIASALELMFCVGYGIYTLLKIFKGALRILPLITIQSHS